jgi:hypothetical protein
VIQETDDNSAPNSDAGSEVSVQTDQERESGEAAGSDAIEQNQGVNDQNGNPVQNQQGPNTGGQVVTENGTETEQSQAREDAEDGTATTFDGTETNAKPASTGETSTSDNASTVTEQERREQSSAGQTTGTANTGSSTSGDTQEDLNTPQSDADLAASLGF